ncbi:MAG: hypothetical protein RLZZ127_1461, partial [Planctomycetota bacterium]
LFEEYAVTHAKFHALLNGPKAR